MWDCQKVRKFQRQFFRVTSILFWPVFVPYYLMEIGKVRKLILVLGHRGPKDPFWKDISWFQTIFLKSNNLMIKLGCQPSDIPNFGHFLVFYLIDGLAKTWPELKNYIASSKNKNSFLFAQKNPQKLLTDTLFFLHYCPELPKGPKQKNSCFKMWLIDQLYIKLGLLQYFCPNHPQL